MKPINMLCVIPSRLGVGEEFTIKVKLRGAVRETVFVAPKNYMPLSVMKRNKFSLSK